MRLRRMRTAGGRAEPLASASPPRPARPRQCLAPALYLHRDREAPFDAEDPDALDKARRYGRERVRLFLLSTAYGLGATAAQLWLRLPRRLGDAIDPHTPQRLRTPLFLLAWSAQGWLIGLPLSYYSGYVVEKRYGLANQAARSWLGEQLKGLAIGSALNTPAATAFFALARRYPSRWWLVASTLALPFTVLLAGLYPVLIAPRFNTYEDLGDPGLEERIRSLAEGEGVRVSRVMRMDMSRQTAKANAFFTGVGGSKRIVLADTLLDGFTPEQVEAVVAHELAHQVHRDVLKLLALSGIGTYAALYAVHRAFPLLARRLERWTGAATIGDPRSLPVLELLGSAFGLVATPLANAYVRRLERSADVYAVRLTRNPRAFIGAMRALQRTNLADPDPPALVRFLLHSHPSIGERVRWAETQLAERDPQPPTGYS